MWFRPSNRHVDDVSWRRDAVPEIERLWHVAATVSVVALRACPFGCSCSFAQRQLTSDGSLDLTADCACWNIANNHRRHRVYLFPLPGSPSTGVVPLIAASLQPVPPKSTDEAVNRADLIHSVALHCPFRASLLFALSLDTN
jgi:hypothetical protein